MTSACLTGFGIVRLDEDLDDILAPENELKSKEIFMYSGMYAENIRPHLKLELFRR